MKQAKDREIWHCRNALCRSTLRRYAKSYDDIIKLAYEEKTLPENIQGKRGKQKRGKVLNLIDRLFTHKGEVCLF